MSLHPVVGHEQVRGTLARALASDGLPAALLLHGPRGVGKQRLALWLAQLQLCEAPGEAGPCDTCRPCRMALALEHPDLHWYFPLPRPRGVSGDRLMDALESARIDALNEIRRRPVRASHGDELRGLYLGLIQSLRRKAIVRPSMGPVQTFIIADAELLVPQESSPAAANALLKLLEEPPPATRFILTSGEPGRLLPTIRSRTVPLHLAALPRETVRRFLTEVAGVDPETAEHAAALSLGSVGRALGFVPDGDDPGPLEELRRRSLVLVQAALAGERARGFKAAISFPPSGARALVDLFAFAEEWLRDLAAVAAGAGDDVVNRDELPRLRRMAATGVQAADVAASIQAVERARELARGNVNPQLVVAGLMRELRAAFRPAGALPPTPTREAR